MMVGNILDYLDWRGDIPLKVSPFNEIDNLIMSVLSYVDIDDIVPDTKTGGYITIHDAAIRFFETHTENELKENRSFISHTYLVLEHLKDSERFKNARLCKFESLTDAKKEMQFAAMHIMLDDGTTYISFRGTDDSLVGWKEDFNMSYKMPVPSQLAAKEYLNKTVHFGLRKYRIGGHSKGGNLAVYAAVECEDRIKNRIINVYSNDGPGFLKGMIESEKYKMMESRIVSIIPESSIIGLLMEHSEDYVIVRSNQIGIMQHDALSWNVVGTKFITLNNLSSEATLLNQTLMNWLNEIDDTKRELFIDAVYNVLISTGATKLSELNTINLKRVNAIVKGFTELDSESRNMIFEILKALTAEYGRMLKDNYLPNKNLD